ncbi:hypothetical protein, partial [Borreliella garinii]|uniref:hypothetical protein n=1 Tax=Borreliella garinii TaxID=29519 RepID=UPI001AEF320D
AISSIANIITSIINGFSKEKLEIILKTYNLLFPNNPLTTSNISQNRIYTYKSKLFCCLMYCTEDKKKE